MLRKVVEASPAIVSLVNLKMSDIALVAVNLDGSHSLLVRRATDDKFVWRRFFQLLDIPFSEQAHLTRAGAIKAAHRLDCVVYQLESDDDLKEVLNETRSC